MSDNENDLKNKVETLSKTVQELSKTIQSLTKKNTNQKIVYNKEDEKFKLFSYYIKSISSIYIYFLLGDEYEQLYKKIENLLHVDPFQQQRNYNEFQKVIQPYPNITNKTKINDIFLYKNIDIRKSINEAYKNNANNANDANDAKKFFNDKNCKYFDFYLENNNQLSDNNQKLFLVLYLDRFKDEEDLTNETKFNEFIQTEFKLQPQNLSIINLTTAQEFTYLSKKRYRNYQYIIGNQLFPMEVLNKIKKEFKDPCKYDN
jgi:hypothetical protein